MPFEEKAKKFTREDAIALLQKKHEALTAAGVTRYPARADFDADEVVAIKAFLGPWPRALEAAGIKTPRDDGRAERTLQKRIRAKRARTLQKKIAGKMPSTAKAAAPNSEDTQ